MEPTFAQKKSYYKDLTSAAISNVKSSRKAKKSASQANKTEAQANQEPLASPNVLLGDDILISVPAGRKPSKILGVAVHDKQLVYLVQWLDDEISKSSAAIDDFEDYGDGLTNANTNVILASAFQEVFPQVAIQMYESMTVVVDPPTLTEEQEVEEAERLLKLKRQKNLPETKEYEEERVDQDLDEELKDDDAARAILRERRMKDMFDPRTSSSESEDDEMDYGLDALVDEDSSC